MNIKPKSIKVPYSQMELYLANGLQTAVNKYWQNLNLAIGNHESHYIICTFIQLHIEKSAHSGSYTNEKLLLPHSEANYSVQLIKAH